MPSSSGVTYAALALLLFTLVVFSQGNQDVRASSLFLDHERGASDHRNQTGHGENRQHGHVDNRHHNVHGENRHQNAHGESRHQNAHGNSRNHTGHRNRQSGHGTHDTMGRHQLDHNAHQGSHQRQTADRVQGVPNTHHHVQQHDSSHSSSRIHGQSIENSRLTSSSNHTNPSTSSNSSLIQTDAVQAAIEALAQNNIELPLIVAPNRPCDPGKRRDRSGVCRTIF